MWRREDYPLLPLCCAHAGESEAADGRLRSQWKRRGDRKKIPSAVTKAILGKENLNQMFWTFGHLARVGNNNRFDMCFTTECSFCKFFEDVEQYLMHCHKSSYLTGCHKSSRLILFYQLNSLGSWV